MGAPEILFLALVVGVACLAAWALVVRHRPRNARHHVRALADVAHQNRPDPGPADPDHDDFWSTP